MSILVLPQLRPNLEADVLVYSSEFPFERKTAEASGFDLHALVPEYRPAPGAVRRPVDAMKDKRVTWLQSLERRCFSTGVYVAPPRGVEAQVRPRSGASLDYGLVAVLGTCDSDYRGEIKVTVINLSRDDVMICHGDRIAQLVFVPVILPEVRRVDSPDELPATARGTKGFGSTGSK